MGIFNPNSQSTSSFIVNPPAENVLSKINEFLQTYKFFRPDLNTQKYVDIYGSSLW